MWSDLESAKQHHGIEMQTQCFHRIIFLLHGILETTTDWDRIQGEICEIIIYFVSYAALYPTFNWM